jgi:uroporphyrinogen decarboxylase
MNLRERFGRVMRYESAERIPLFDFGYWNETLERWRSEGLPANFTSKNVHLFWGFDFCLSDATYATGVNAGLVPPFNEIILEDRGEEEVVQQADGVRVLRKKFHDTIPAHLGHLLVDRGSWEKYYKPRLSPDHPDRMPPDLSERVMRWAQPGYSELVVPWVGGLYGWIRDWMGVEAVSLIIYDDPAFFEEMVETIADCILATLGRLLEAGANVDACAFWEDMCYNAGPLISPRHFKKFLSPHYRRITDLLDHYGVGIRWVDSDGNIEKLIPLWLDCGINCLMPVEVGTWDGDPLRYRQQFGRELRMMGGFSKRILASTPKEIEKEVYRLLPLVEEGGFIGFCDHLVPPDVPLQNYLYFTELVRAVWGHGANLSPRVADEIFSHGRT